MATKLYEILEIDATATSEEIRKAYKKRALKTHPDRLPRNATEAEKKASEEEFRKVNQAYEILIDEEKRKEYDFHGVWPPPDIEEIPRPSGSCSHFDHFDDAFSHPFFHHHHRHHPFHSFTFTDPFALFDSIFGDFAPRRQGFGGGFGASFFMDDPFDRFAQLERQMEAEFNGFHSGFSMFSSPFGLLGGFAPRGFLAGPGPMSNGGGRSGARWVSESFSTQSINGVTQSVHRRRDAEGNEHVTRIFPDGREVYTINGVEQPSRGQIENKSASNKQLPPPQQTGYSTSRSQTLPVQRNSSLNMPPPPPYTPQTTAHHHHHQYHQPRVDRQGDYNMGSPPTTTPEVRRHRESESRRRSSSSSHYRDRDRDYRDHRDYYQHRDASHSKPSTPGHRPSPRYPYQNPQPDRDHHRRHHHRQQQPQYSSPVYYGQDR
ncbi:DnaJ protein, variant 2 [Coprinopsis cinerea AmutBmut pab1-1]|nr:DnaJ protein, variant 2 [Coprinopsis cinerea AmutBmut pab1-1]